MTAAQAFDTPPAGAMRAVAPLPELEPLHALGVIARHVAFVHAGRRTGRNRLALDLVIADIDRVLGDAGMTRRIDDRGDEWADYNGSPVAWIGHRAERERSTIRP